MNKYLVRGFVVVALALAPAGLSGQAAVQEAQKPFEPVSGQPGKDVVWVPTPQSTVDKMLELTKVTAKDYLIDLGSCDGITVITAARKGATAVGVEFNPEMVALARKRAAEAGVADHVTFIQGDLFEADLSKATVITLFLLPDINARLRPKLLELAPGTRIASNSFDMGDWEPDARETSSPCTQWCTALYWMVPAKVEGTWQLGSQPLTLTQHYQKVSGTLGTTAVTGKLAGVNLTLTAGSRTYSGRVNGSTIEGKDWKATRTKAAAAAAGKP
jgi:methyltransferase family protein